MRNTKGQFAKGNKTWNTGLKGVMPIPWNKGKEVLAMRGNTFAKGNIPWNKGIEWHEMSGKNSPTFIHGMRHTRFYITWRNMRRRCVNPKDNSFKHYGGRGIKCEWKSFEEFRGDMHKEYQTHNSKFGEANTFIERVDNNGNYCKTNCRWATRFEQNRNRRDTVFVTFRGKDTPLREVAEVSGYKFATLYKRVVLQGWDIEKALSVPLKKNQFG